MRSLGVHELYVLDDQDPFEMPLAQMVAPTPSARASPSPRHDSLARPPATSFTGEVEKIVESGAQAVFFAGTGRAPEPSRCGASCTAPTRGCCCSGRARWSSESFTSQIGAAAPRAHYLTHPGAAPSQLLPGLGAARARGLPPAVSANEPGAYALYGYEAMSAVLDAIRAAGRARQRPPGGDRRACSPPVDRDSVIGRYSIEPDGETTLSRYGVDRVSAAGVRCSGAR